MWGNNNIDEGCKPPSDDVSLAAIIKHGCSWYRITSRSDNLRSAVPVIWCVRLPTFKICEARTAVIEDVYISMRRCHYSNMKTIWKVGHRPPQAGMQDPIFVRYVPHKLLALYPADGATISWVSPTSVMRTNSANRIRAYILACGYQYIYEVAQCPKRCNLLCWREIEWSLSLRPDCPW